MCVCVIYLSISMMVMAKNYPNGLLVIQLLTIWLVRLTSLDYCLFVYLFIGILSVDFLLAYLSQVTFILMALYRPFY